MKYKIWIGCLLALYMSGCAMGLKHSALVEGTPMSYITDGEGKPTIVLEAGLGDDLSTWKPVYDELNAMTHVVAYSRAGYAGNSMSGVKNAITTSDDVVRHQRKLLRKAGISPPYILVGHSIGGLYIQRFAALYPQEVVGLVLIDGRAKSFKKECERAEISPCAPPSAVAAIAPGHIGAELRGIEASEQMAPNPEDLADIPITIIAATEPPPGAPDGAQAIWLEVLRQFAHQVKNGRFVLAEGSGHYIHKDQPDLVISEIQRMIKELR